MLRKSGIRHTWSAEIPFMRAFFTLSLVIEPTTRLGKRYFKETNKFRTAVCSALSMPEQESEKGANWTLLRKIRHLYRRRLGNWFLE